ncbi:fimbrial family protein [Yersinia ruckeri]|uniref:fimbrial protein n=1 Tax=Yersinia ruckeri TaxID=29486 RepID=UPI0005AD4524|nr:fimbrial protein [Yersinia ruckeri]AJI96351.1 fimbrial family protein [Yersinia ruckeri]
MFNLKNKPLATSYFTKKSFSLLAVAIIGYLLTPAASASNPIEIYCLQYADIPIPISAPLIFSRNGGIKEQELFSPSTQISFQCGGYLSDGVKKIYLELVPVGATKVAGIDNLYETNVPGIGIRFALGIDSRCTRNPVNPAIMECPADKIHQLVVDAPPHAYLVNYANNQTSSRGNITLPDNLEFKVRYDNGPEKTLLTIQTGHLTYEYKRYGCTLETPSVNLPLGEVKANEFRGIGSMSKTNIAKQIHLTCDPDTSYSLTINGKSVANYPDILQLDQTSGHASGIGVKFEAGDSTKKYQDMKLGEETYMHKTDSNGVSIKKIIDIRASYFQTENRITPGTANASATFTVTYQ